MSNENHVPVRKGFKTVYWCLRCKTTVENFRCNCTESPSPWDIKVERVEVKAGPRKLEGKWTFELLEPVHLYYYEPWYKRLWKKIMGM